MKSFFSRAWFGLALVATLEVSAQSEKPGPAPGAIKPRIVSDTVKHDTDDPAIWINRSDPAASLILGTDKDVDGALYVFGLDGKVHADKVVRGIVRPNNVDVAYDLMVNGKLTDVAVVTERYANRLRVYRLPDMAPIDGGGLPVFTGELARDCMGVALYTRASDGARRRGARSPARLATPLRPRHLTPPTFATR